MSTIPQLPFDLYVHIIRHVDDPKDLACCSCTNAQVRSAAMVPTVWEPFYRARYRFCDEEREKQRKNEFNGHWGLMYFARRRLDRRALQLLDSMLEERSGRHERARELTKDLSLDVWDALTIESNCAIPLPLRQLGILDETPQPAQLEAVPHALTRRFWASAMLGAIARKLAIQVWSTLSSPNLSDRASLEDALGGLSSFYGYCHHEFDRTYDALAEACGAFLDKERIARYSLDQSYDVSKLCTAICDFLRKEGFGRVESSQFHHLRNHFPHRFLTTNRHTIPLPLVSVFVSVARRLGLQASPVDFPSKVIAHVSSVDPAVDDIYVDVTDARVLSARDDIPHMLIGMGIPLVNMMRYIHPVTAGPMLLRSAHNIFASQQILTINGANTLSAAETEPAMYAALCAKLLTMDSVDHVGAIRHLLASFPLDAGTVLHDTLAPLLLGASVDELTNLSNEFIEEDERAAQEVKRRSDGHVRHFVGMVFEHRRYKYVGCIAGWDPQCAASEQWIYQMGVDQLPRGRKQPFYQVFASDGPQRYVAEENIQPLLTFPTNRAAEFFRISPSFARYFEDFHAGDLKTGNARARMLLSPEMRAQYPDDDAAGEDWVAEWSEKDVMYMVD